MTIMFEQGEIRHVKLKIRNMKGENFSITHAEYEFRKKYNREIVSQGGVNIVDHVLDVVIETPERGDYLLKYTYVIGDETLVDIVEVKVI